MAEALWTRRRPGDRRAAGFQRTYDLAERVIPEELRSRPLRWASARGAAAPAPRRTAGPPLGTLAATWRLAGKREALEAALG